jgi:hypothetical protein
MYPTMPGGLRGRGGGGREESRLDVLGETLRRGENGRARRQSDGACRRCRERQHGFACGGIRIAVPMLTEKWRVRKKVGSRPGPGTKEKILRKNSCTAQQPIAMRLKKLQSRLKLAVIL